MKTAMDEFESKLRAELKEAMRRAARCVQSSEMLSRRTLPSEIYGFALDQMKVDRKGVEGVPALRALFNLAASAIKGSCARVRLSIAACRHEEVPERIARNSSDAVSWHSELRRRETQWHNPIAPSGNNIGSFQTSVNLYNPLGG